MADALLKPDNRSLGSSTHDLGLYGGQPDPDKMPALDAEQDMDKLASSEASSGSTALPATPVTGDSAAIQTIGPSGGDPAAASAGDIPAAHAYGSHAAHSAMPDPVAIAAAGAGTDPTLLDPSQDAGPTLHSLLPLDSAPSYATGAFSLSSTAPNMALADAGHVTSLLSAASPVATLDQAAVIAHAVADLPATATEAADQVAMAATDAVLGAPGLAVDTGDAANHLASTGAAVLPAAADAGAPIVSPVLDSLFSAAAPAGADTLVHASGDAGALSGSDPPAGITTLVGMVQTSELFSVGPSTADAGTTEHAGSIVDSLIGEDAQIAPVLGDTSHTDASHSGATSTAVDHVIDPFH